MSFWMLASLFTSLYALIFRIAEPSLLSSFEYYSGLVLCFAAARVFASRSEYPVGDRVVITCLVMLIPAGGICLLGYGIWLQYGTPAAEVVSDTLPDVVLCTLTIHLTTRLHFT
ncbi:MAG: hypothetical protein PW844_20735 [Pantoea sp.]|uniref:hypothetical protein n=1 Tax=Pantoea sp. TaxID=69393 RepID=UPI00239B828C|nr:hypothetical protein [Pantoea sp.]MDE1188859.1 hypothetical protein [Pantoea sp.]